MGLQVWEDSVYQKKLWEVIWKTYGEDWVDYNKYGLWKVQVKLKTYTE